MAEVNALMDAAMEALTGEALLLAGGFASILLQLDYSGVMRDPDGLTRHGVVRFRIKVQED
jgi:hypothetical protein